jgi:hypothetical protein
MTSDPWTQLDPTTSEEQEADDSGQESPRLPQNESQATKLVRLAVDARAEFFHTPDGDPYARILVGDHWEVWPQRRKGFKNWLRGLYYKETGGGAPNSQATQDALGVLGGRALFAGKQHPVFTRVGELDGALYHDLANEVWEAVEVTADGWRVVSDPPVYFRRTRGMLPLPLPEHGGSLDELRRWANAGSDDDLHLYIGWLIQALRASGPFIGYSAHGEQGSAKSTRGRIARALLDPNSAPLRTRPRDERDLLIAATNSWLVTLDNLSWLPDWFSDALSRLSTGGGLSTRELYTDADEVIFDAQRPMFLNGIEEVATRGDLLDRLVIAHLPRISDEKRKPEDALWAEFEEARPRLYGALLDAVSCALRNVESVRLTRHPRMADAARWVAAAEPALGWREGTFLDAYERNRAERSELALEASPIAQLLLDQVGFKGTATALLERLEQNASEKLLKSKSWPKSVQSLGGVLTRLAPNLRAAGVDVSKERETTGRKRKLIALRAVGQEADTTDTQTPEAREAASEASLEEGDRTGDRGARGAQAVTSGAASADTGVRPLPTRDFAASRGAGDRGDQAVRRRSEDVSEEDIASVFVRYPEYDLPDWPEDQKRRFAESVLAREEKA